MRWLCYVAGSERMFSPFNTETFSFIFSPKQPQKSGENFHIKFDDCEKVAFNSLLRGFGIVSHSFFFASIEGKGEKRQN